MKKETFLLLLVTRGSAHNRALMGRGLAGRRAVELLSVLFSDEAVPPGSPRLL